MYDSIGTTYALTRRTEPRIAEQVWAALATVHHWQDPIAGMRETRRVASRVVVFTCETTERSWRRRFWLTRDYLPEVVASPVGLATELARAIGVRVEPVLVPWDCADGFFEA